MQPSESRTRHAIGRKIDELETEPETRGKPMTGDLRGFHSVRAAGQRYRVVYRVRSVEGVVTVLVIGIRKEGDRQDVYRVAKRRLGEG